ncbi:hypothetical protein, variant [Cladophialophora immunda]|uniref:Uncharacterized protein n=1 Tax=Cladophialophora immunda TaxID=569365 RepID=A0A0D1ZV51_9EURO|nr:hypothetical protein, variant [Cladophialophora immunda]KIW31986.1 hypothetical protein, variant [Cladophialophora immunda]
MDTKLQVRWDCPWRRHPRLHLRSFPVTSHSDDLRTPNKTDVEIYLSRSLGFALVLIALIAIFFTGTIPLSSSISEPVSLEDNDPKAPYARPILQITTFFHSFSMVYCYMRYVNYEQTAYMLGALGYGILASVGIWSVIFGSTEARRSKRTGADKRTSGFPFKNSQAYDKRKDRKMG